MKNTKAQGYSQSITFLKRLISKHLTWIYVFFGSIIVSSLFTLILPYLAKLEIDQLVEQSDTLLSFTMSPLGIFIFIIVIELLVDLVYKLLQSVTRYYQNTYQKIFEDEYFIQLYHRLKYIELGVYANKKNQNLFGKILGKNRIIESIMKQTSTILETTIFVLGSFGLLYTIDWKIGVGLCIGGASYYIFYRLKRKHGVINHFNLRELERAISNIKRLTETEFHKLVYIGGNNLLLKTMEKHNKENRTIMQDYQKKNETRQGMSHGVDKLIEYGIKIIIGISILNATTSVGSMAMTIALLSTLSNHISSLVHSRKEFDDTKEDLMVLELYLSATQETDTPKIATHTFSEIRISNLSFAYPTFTSYELQYFDIILDKLSLSTDKSDRDLDKIHAIQEVKKNANHQNPQILKDISIQFETGKVYGVIGKNGAGKTTLMHLIMSYFSSYKGSISRGGLSQHKLAFEHFEQHIAVVEQDPFLLRGFTIRQNLLVGVTRAYSDEELYTVLAQFDLEKLIRTMRKGLDTIYSYDCNFSGGQQQLISLLRVYLQDKQVMILDEGTNQLDAENEAKIMNLLFQNKQDKIIILVSHRMTTHLKADYLYCLEDGTITDQGTPKDLKEKDTLYSRLWKEQIG